MQPSSVGVRVRAYMGRYGCGEQVLGPPELGARGAVSEGPVFAGVCVHWSQSFQGAS